MSIIQDRIRPLALPASDCAPLSKQQLENFLSSVRPLLAAGSSNLATQVFSITDLAPEVVTAKLKSFGIPDQTVFVLWPAFREGFKIKWELFTARFDDFWYPSSDDLIVTSPTGSWALVITHEEIFRLYQFDIAKHQQSAV